jgi:hypothetical protein
MMTFCPTSVEATYTPDGWPVPSRLVWDNHRLIVIDIGRRWKEENGIHLLVRVSDERVFELHTNGSLWWARLVSGPPHVA